VDLEERRKTPFLQDRPGEKDRFTFSERKKSVTGQRSGEELGRGNKGEEKKTDERCAPLVQREKKFWGRSVGNEGHFVEVPGNIRLGCLSRGSM